MLTAALLVLSLAVGSLAAGDQVTSTTTTTPMPPVSGNVVESLLASKMNRLVSNSTTSTVAANVTSAERREVKNALTKRSFVEPINKEAKSEVLSTFWRIPTMLISFVTETLLMPLLTSVQRLFKLVINLLGLDGLFETASTAFLSSPVGSFLQERLQEWLPDMSRYAYSV